MRLFARRNNSDEDPLKMYYSYGTIHMAVGVPPDFSRAEYGLQNFGVDRFKSGSRVARFEVRTYGPFNNPDSLTFVLNGLPTSDSDIPSGTV